MNPSSIQKIGTWSTRMVESTLARYPLKEAQWHYEHGLQVMAIEKAGEITGEPRYINFVTDWVDYFVKPDGTIRTYTVEEYNLDQINAGRLLFSAFRRSGDERYRKAIELLMTQLADHPRTNSNGYWHKKIYPYQMWLDGIYMGSPFRAEYAQTFNQPEIFDDIIHNVVLIEKQTRDPETGLLYHAWDESKQQRWCNPETGCSLYFWSRAVGWFIMAVVDILDYLPENHEKRQILVEILNRTVEAVVKVQDEASGLWYQILDLPDRKGNYLEASGSTMFVYGIAKGVRLGYLPAHYVLSARRGYHGILENLIKVDRDGLLTLDNVCGGAGLGGDPYRDGSFEYYISEKIIPNDPKGVGPFILAALEMEQAGVDEVL
jgi:unsaturated rhamnogalacturonyl hydrolase